MTTLSVLKARIADDLRRTDLTGQIAGAVSDAIKRWEGERFWFNEKRFRIDTVANQEEYEIPGSLINTDGSELAAGENLFEVDVVRVLEGSSYYPLADRTEQFFAEYQTPVAFHTGVPNYYGIYANRIRLGPVPDKAYQIDVSGLARLATLKDGDTNAWTDEAESLIRHQALAEIFRTVTRDPDGFQLANGAVQDALVYLKAKSSNKITRGRIKAWGCS